MQAYEVRDNEAAGSKVGRGLQGWEEHLIEAGAPLSGRRYSQISVTRVLVQPIICSTGIPLARSRRVQSTYLSHCPLSSYLRGRLTSAKWIISHLKKFQEC